LDRPLARSAGLRGRMGRRLAALPRVVRLDGDPDVCAADRHDGLGSLAAGDSDAAVADPARGTLRGVPAGVELLWAHPFRGDQWRLCGDVPVSLEPNRR